MLTKEISIEINKYNPSIRTVNTKWYGFNSRGEWVYHSKSVTCFSENHLLHFCYYVPVLGTCIFRDIDI